MRQGGNEGFNGLWLILFQKSQKLPKMGNFGHFWGPKSVFFSVPCAAHLKKKFPLASPACGPPQGSTGQTLDQLQSPCQADLQLGDDLREPVLRDARPAVAHPMRQRGGLLLRGVQARRQAATGATAGPHLCGGLGAL